MQGRGQGDGRGEDMVVVGERRGVVQVIGLRVDWWGVVQVSRTCWLRR